MKQENQPIKRGKELVQLSREHHNGLLLSWKIRTGLDKGVEMERITRYVQAFYEADLKNHFLKEEELVFSLLPGNELVERAIAEHRELEDMISAIAGGSVEQLRMLPEKLDSHIRFEERVLFNRIEAEAPSEALTKVGETIKALHEDEVPFQWEDEFWLIKK